MTFNHIIRQYMDMGTLKLKNHSLASWNIMKNRQISICKVILGTSYRLENLHF